MPDGVSSLLKALALSPVSSNHSGFLICCISYICCFIHLILFSLPLFTWQRPTQVISWFYSTDIQAPIFEIQAPQSCFFLHLLRLSKAPSQRDPMKTPNNIVPISGPRQVPFCGKDRAYIFGSWHLQCLASTGRWQRAKWRTERLTYLPKMLLEGKRKMGRETKFEWVCRTIESVGSGNSGFSAPIFASPSRLRIPSLRFPWPPCVDTGGSYAWWVFPTISC